MQIETKNLSFTYSPSSKELAVAAIKDVCITIKEGDFFGIIGHTGSGKSTFVQHLNGLIKIQKNSGTITVGEFDLTDKKCDFKNLRAKVGMVFQYPEYQLFAETVFDDIAFGIRNFNKKLTEKEVESAVRSAMEFVGLDYKEYKDKSPFALSGGQKRRVAIAGVIVSCPEVLILDEPVAGLDPQGKKEFIALLHHLKKSLVKTIVIVSHDMNLVSENCNKVAVFDKGCVVKTGSPKEIFLCDDKIEEMGLELPITAKITKTLVEKEGIKIDSDLTSKDFVEKLVLAIKDGGQE